MVVVEKTKSPVSAVTIGSVSLLEELNPKQEAIIKELVSQNNGEIDIFVHPGANRNLADPEYRKEARMLEFNVPSAYDDTTLEVYDQYQHRVNEYLLKEKRVKVVLIARDNRLKVISAEEAMKPVIEQTLEFATQNPSGFVVVVPTLDKIDPTPFFKGLGENILEGSSYEERESGSKRSWDKLSYRLKSWGVKKINLGGEGANYQRTSDGRVQWKSEECLYYAWQNLTRFFGHENVKLMDELSFPVSIENKK